MQPFVIPLLVKIAQFPNVNDSQRSPMTRLSTADLGERRANPVANKAVVRSNRRPQAQYPIVKRLRDRV